MRTLMRPIFILSLLGMVISPVATTSAVTLLSPNGEEALAGGAVFEVKWEGSVGEVTYELKYSINGGKQWKKITKGLSGTSYDWTVPLLKTNYKDCRVMIIGYNASRKKVSEDISDLSFAIDVVSITSPAGEEELTPGTIHTITWATTPALTSVGQVLLKYSVNNGKKWTTIGTIAENPGTYDWEVPLLGGPLYECKVMVELRDGKGKKLVQGFSDGVFSIGWTPETFSDAIATEFGEDGSFDALVLATDKGYSLSQVINAFPGGRLGTDGVIKDNSGKIEKPENPPTNLFEDMELSGKVRDLASNSKLEALRVRLKSNGEIINMEVNAIMIYLFSIGYELEQIVDLLLIADCWLSRKEDHKCDLWLEGWHSEKKCDEFSYRWQVGITSSKYVESSCQIKGVLFFHDCPGGGRVTYEFRDGVLPLDPTIYIVDGKGKLINPANPPAEAFVSKDYIKVEGALTFSAGPLGEDAALWVKFKIERDKPPQPNFAP